MDFGKSVGVIGCGNSARALSCYLMNDGREVNMLVRSKQREEEVPKTLQAIDKIKGNFCLNMVTSDVEKFMDSSDVIFFATVTTAYSDVVYKILPYIKSNHKIILFSSKFGGVCEVSNILSGNGLHDIPVIETDAIFACRIMDENKVWVKGFKKWNLYSCETKGKTEENGYIITEFFPFLKRADNFFQRGLSDFGAMTHPLIMLINMNAIDRKQSFSFYYEGFTPKTFRLLEALERETKELASAYGTQVISLRELLDNYYSCLRDSLYETLLSVPNYKSSVSPSSLDNRYIYEDVSNTLVPLHYLAVKAGVNTMLLDSIISMSSVVLDYDFLAEGRTLEKLGLGSMNYEDILNRLSE